MTADPIWKIRNVPPETRRRALEMAELQGVTVARYLSQVINADYDRKPPLADSPSVSGVLETQPPS